MPCNIASHQHVWPTEGILVIEKCEIYCGFCTGDAARNWHKHAWFLRRHAEGHVKSEYPNLTIDAGWDPLHPRGIGFNENREMKQQEKLAGSNGKKKSDKKKQGSKSAAKPQASPFDVGSDIEMINDSLVTRSGTHLDQFGTSDSVNASQSQQETGVAFESAQLDNDHDAQHATCDMDLDHILAGEIDWTDPIWASLNTKSELDAVTQLSDKPTADSTSINVDEIVTYLKQVIDGKAQAKNVPIGLRRGIVAYLGANKVMECMERRAAKREAKARESAANALAYRMNSAAPTPVARSTTTSGNIGLGGLKKNRNMTMKGFLRAQASAAKNAQKQAAKEAAKAAKAAEKQASKAAAKTRKMSTARGLGSQAPPYNFSFRNNFAYVNGAPLSQRHGSFSNLTGQQPSFVDITDNIESLECAQSVALGRNCAAAHKGNVVAANVASADQVSARGQPRPQGVVAQSFSRGKLATVQGQGSHENTKIAADQPEFADRFPGNLASGYMTALGTYFDTPLGQPLMPADSTTSPISDPNQAAFEELLQFNGIPSAGEIDDSYATAQGGCESEIYQAQGFRETTGFVNPFDVTTFAANGSEHLASMSPMMLLPISVTDFSALFPPMGPLGSNDMTSAGSYSEQENGSFSSTQAVGEVDDLAILFPNLPGSNATTSEVSFEDFLDSGLDNDFAFGVTQDAAMPTNEPAQDGQDIQADDDAAFIAHARGMLSG